MRRLFEGGTYSSNYCNWELKSLLQLGQIVITFRTLLEIRESQNLAKLWGGWPIVWKEWKAGRELEAPM